MAYTTIKKSTDYNNTILFTGNNSSLNVTGVDFQPDLVWFKPRNGEDSHSVYDALRTATKRLKADTDGAETTQGNGLTAFGSDGFTVGSHVGTLNVVSWNWKAGTTSGIAGSPTITPTSYSFNQTSGFSIIKYVGNGTSDATIPHGLSTAPKVVIIKNLTTQEGWVVGHEGIRGAGEGWTKIMKLNTTAAAATSSAYFGNVAPSATLVTLGNDGGVNTNTDNYIAYCFSEITGYSKISSYTGNGNVDGPFIYTGFKPAFILVHNSSSGAEWEIYDNKRIGYNSANYHLNPSDESVESTLSDRMDILSNGFKIRVTNSGPLNNTGGGDNYTYMAFASEPLVGDNPTTAR